MVSEVHQVVHGYDRGHTQLASSIQIKAADQDLLTRLSDLSGALMDDRNFGSYLTLYPLPSRSFYVIARTWLDTDVPRAGCVLTHSLLVPLGVWARHRNPFECDALFRRPSRDSLESYEKPLATGAAAQTLPPVHDRRVREFIARYFGEGVQPLVWFDPEFAETVLWRMVRVLWPSLRGQFSCCTYSLKPRALDDRPFDILFAPQQVRSRFAEYPQEYVVQLQRTGNEAVQQETWISDWTHSIFDDTDSHEESPPNDRIRVLAQGLEADPTAIRRVFLYRTLYNRSEAIPMAAVGALDVLNTLTVQKEFAIKDITHLVENALTSSSSLKSTEEFEILYLLSERATIVDDARVQGDIRRAICTLLNRRESLLAHVDELTGHRSLKAPAVFVEGVADAVLQRLRTGSDGVVAVINLNKFGGVLATQCPEVIESVLVAGRVRHSAATTKALCNWCTQVRETSARVTLRLRILPLLLSAEEQLGRDLLRDVVVSEISPLCKAIERGPSAMNLDLGRLYAELLSNVSKSAIHEWARHTGAATCFSSYALGSTLSTDELNVDYLLSRRADRKASVAVLAFVEQVIRGPCDWWQRRAEEDEALWSVILAGSFDGTFVDTLGQIVRHTPRSAIARASGARTQSSALPSSIQDYVIKQWMVDWIDKGLEMSEPSVWLHEGWIANKLEREPALITQCLASCSEFEPKSWMRAWQLVRSVPISTSWLLNANSALDNLVHRRPPKWQLEASEAWRDVIEVLQAQPQSHLDACTRALHFCLHHLEVPVGPVVGAAFFPVHAAALEQRVSSLWSVFSFFEWDHGVELRRHLVTAFSRSSWPPEWFVVAAREPWLLRKLCRRMLRQWDGEQFLQRAYDGLGSLTVSVDPQLIETMREVLRNPHFDEPWD